MPRELGSESGSDHSTPRGASRGPPEAAAPSETSDRSGDFVLYLTLRRFLRKTRLGRR